MKRRRFKRLNILLSCLSVVLILSVFSFSVLADYDDRSPTSGISYYTPSVYNDTWTRALNAARSDWNNPYCGVLVASTTDTTGSTLYVTSSTDSWGGRVITDMSGPSYKFTIMINSYQIYLNATNLSNFIRSVAVHEIGHVLGLADNPNTARASIMKYSRDRNTLYTAQSYDRERVNAIYADYNNYPTVLYKAHVQDYGWQPYFCNGGTAGTEGESKRLEGISIILQNLDGNIEYRSHVQDYGWLPWITGGATSGTIGESRRLEAIGIKLSGQVASQYDIYYRVHVQNFGWLDWAMNGQSAGTVGYSYRMEAIQIVLVQKGGAAPGATTRAFVQA